MDELIKSGNVALITGAAMGIGRAAAKRFAKAGMKLALVDLAGDDLSSTAAMLKADGADVVVIEQDLSEVGAAKRVYDEANKAFGVVHLLMNNAVTREGRTFEGTMAEWRKSFDVNVWSLIELVRLFQDDMIASGERCAIVNVGSKQGITNPPGTPAYNMAKAAVKSFTEQLEHHLRNDEKAGGRVTSHLLVPGWTTTGKNEHKQGAWLPEQVVDYMLEGLKKGSFYMICPDDDVTPEMDSKRIHWAAGDITEDRPPLSRWHADYKEEAAKACS